MSFLQNLQNDKFDFINIKKKCASEVIKKVKI